MVDDKKARKPYEYLQTRRASLAVFSSTHPSLASVWSFGSPFVWVPPRRLSFVAGGHLSRMLYSCVAKHLWGLLVVAIVYSGRLWRLHNVVVVVCSWPCDFVCSSFRVLVDFVCLRWWSGWTWGRSRNPLFAAVVWLNGTDDGGQFGDA